MPDSQIPKYPDEYILEFRSVDRFIFRASDLNSLDAQTANLYWIDSTIATFTFLENVHVCLLRQQLLKLRAKQSSLWLNTR